MKSDRKPTSLEAVPDALCRLGAEGQGRDGHFHQVIDTPARDHGVIKHDGGGYKADECTHPGKFLPGEFGKGPDDSHSAFAPKSVLRNDQRHAPDEQKDQPGNEKCAGTVLTGILGGNAWETPDIARTDGDAEYAKNHSEARGKTLISLIHR